MSLNSFIYKNGYSNNSLLGEMEKHIQAYGYYEEQVLDILSVLTKMFGKNIYDTTISVQGSAP